MTGTDRQRRRSARLVARSELAAMWCDPLRRPYGLLGLLLVAAAAVPGIALTVSAAVSAADPAAGSGAVPGAIALAVAAAVGMSAYWSLAVYLATYLGARRQFRIAVRTWMIESGDGSATAALVDVDGTAVLRCVAAQPRGKGFGGRLLAGICAEADRDGIDLTLQAVNTRAARLYRRFGFAETGRSHLPGRRPMRRPAHPAACTD